MKMSARTQLKGKVVSVKDGADTGIVTLELPDGQQIVSSITMDSIKNLGLKPGVEAFAIIKASSVMMGVD
jgi:molybdopterin-binding protein